tara:strand:+ start:1970 stop:2281 length:312 start_codon:yes stop_codon:yes gene_type:complete
MSGTSRDYGYSYETVAAGQTAQVLGTTGAKGDYLHRVIISTVTAASGGVTIKDGSISIVIQTAAATLPIGVQSIEINLSSADGAWAVTTGAGATVIGIGLFTA